MAPGQTLAYGFAGRGCEGNLRLSKEAAADLWMVRLLFWILVKFSQFRVEHGRGSVTLEQEQLNDLSISMTRSTCNKTNPGPNEIDSHCDIELLLFLRRFHT